MTLPLKMPARPPGRAPLRAAAACVLWAALSAHAAPARSPAAATSPAQAASAAEPELPTPTDAAPPSSLGQRIYSQTKPRLLQVRTLLKTQDSQSSVGSGFLVSNDGHLITNYHVVSQYALKPDRHRLVYVSADGQQGPLDLLAVDVIHDLALLKPADPKALAGRGAIGFRPSSLALERGARMFALGNPLDVGFAVNEGAFNGPVERSFTETLFFGGAMSPGMSGGPALDEQGRLVGVNVAKRLDGEQVSFLIPAKFAESLLNNARNGKPITAPAYPQLTEQITAHQQHLTERFMALPWRSAGHSRYTIPVPQETFMRCWGQGAGNSGNRGLQFEHTNCEMDSRLYINGSLALGHIGVRHEVYDGKRIGPLRFAERHSGSFGNEHFGFKSGQTTAPQCKERTVHAGDSASGLPLRAVVCISAYKKLPGLYRMGVLVATLDQSTGGVQGRLDAVGVSFENGLKLAQHYINGFGWIAPQNASR